MHTPERFRSLAAMLTAEKPPAAESPVELETEEFVEPDGDVEDLVRDVRLFRARVIEATEAAVETLLEDIAADVLARELRLEPADIETIVNRALERFAAEEPLRVRVHAEDAVRIRCGVPVVADARLRRGDAVIELRSGSLDVSLGVRLDSILGALSA